MHMDQIHSDVLLVSKLPSTPDVAVKSPFSKWLGLISLGPLTHT